MRYWPKYTTDEIDLVSQILRSGKVNYWTGDLNKQFEKAFGVFAQSNFALTISNGTHALECALRALGIGHGDSVIVPTRTYFGTVSAVLSVGAHPIFCDICESTGNIDIDTLNLRDFDIRPRAMIAVHMSGIPCDMETVVGFCLEKDILLIEDCAQAHGAKYDGRPVGTFGIVGAWSFCQDKLISTGGEGGAITTNSKSVESRVRSLRDHGKDTVRWGDLNGIEFNYLIEDVGSNYRLTEIQAALGLVQLGFFNDRRITRERYFRILSDAAHDNEETLSLVDPEVSGGPTGKIQPAHYRATIKLQTGNQRRADLIRSIRAIGIDAGVGSCCDCNHEPIIQKLYPSEYKREFQVSRWWGLNTLAVPIDHTTPENLVHEVADLLRRFR